MTERERMLTGEPYRSRDPELLTLYHKAQALLAAFRATASTELDEKQRILSSLLGHVGDNVWIEAPFYCDYGAHISIGSSVFINYNCVFLDSNTITIGDNTLIGPGVQIYTATHPLNANDRILYENVEGKEAAYYVTHALPVHVGNNAWIGGGALLMPGVTVGDNTTIGAGSVVTKSVPSDSVAAGNPCTVIRHLG